MLESLATSYLHRESVSRRNRDEAWSVGIPYNVSSCLFSDVVGLFAWRAKLARLGRSDAKCWKENIRTLMPCSNNFCGVSPRVSKDRKPLLNKTRRDGEDVVVYVMWWYVRFRRGSRAAAGGLVQAGTSQY